MSRISLKIAYPIIITGLFVIVVFLSVTYDIIDPNFYIVLVPLTAFLFLFGFAIGQRFAVPVKKLLKEADYITKGDLKKRFALENHDELGDLAKYLNEIAEEMQENKSKIGSLGEQVKLRTKTLEEIILVLEQKVKNRNAEFKKVVDQLDKTQKLLAIREKELLMLNNRNNKKKK